MANEPQLLRAQVSHNHRRVISVRLRLLEEASLKLLGLFGDSDSALTARLGLPKEKAQEIAGLVRDLGSKISRAKSELHLEVAHWDTHREAGALVAAMAVNVEELHPAYLKGYGEVPEALAMYLEVKISELLQVLARIDQALGKPVSEVKPTG